MGKSSINAGCCIATFENAGGFPWIAIEFVLQELATSSQTNYGSIWFQQKKSTNWDVMVPPSAK